MRVGQQLCRYARAAESGPRNAVARARLTLTTVLLLGLVTLGAQTPAVAQVQPGPFSCATPTAFLAQDSPTTMLAQEYGDGEVTYTPVGPNATSEWHYNAIGFRPVDEYIYAISGDLDVAHPPGHLLQIDSTGAVTDLGAVAGDPNLQTENIFRGAFDDAGFFYVGVPTGTGGELTIDRIDVTASPPSVTSSTPLTARMQANDFTFANGFLWALARATANPAVIYRIDAVSGRVDEFTAPVQIEADGSYGGAWTYGNGNLGFSANQSGNVHQISVANPSSASPTFSLVSTNSGPGSGNNDGTSCVPDPADLRLAKSASPVRVAPGGQVAFTLVVTNNGPGISSGWVVDDQVPGEMTNVASSTPGCSVTGNLVRCLGGTLGVGQSRTIRITATAPATPETTVTNTGSVFGNEEDENPLNNQASADVTTEPVSDVSIVKTAPTEALVNETVTYTLRVTNDGPSSATGVVGSG